MSQTTIVETILQTIGQSAETNANAVISHAQKRQQEALDREEKRIREQQTQRKKEGFDQIRTAAGKEICAAENKARAKLFHHRETIRLEVMEQARAEIESFTKTPAYEEFLVQAAIKIREKMQGNCGVLNMRECDTHLAAKVSAHLGHSITLHTDPSIVLGGITVISADGTLIVDFTLDTRLTQQNTWFTEHSGLTIE